MKTPMGSVETQSKYAFGLCDTGIEELLHVARSVLSTEDIYRLDEYISYAREHGGSVPISCDILLRFGIGIY